MTGEGGTAKGLIWLTWRQHRWPIIVSTVITAVLVVLMLVTASELASMAHKCLTAAAGECRRDKTEPTPSHASYLLNTVVFLPVLTAVFWGVPLLAREFEQRTLPLAWSQDVSRLKWLTGKTAVMIVLIATMGAALAAAAIHLAYEYHAYTSESLFDGTLFQAGGWLPLTLGLAWLAVGIAAGAATRRVLAAIAVVGGLWMVRVVGMVQLRPYFLTPISSIRPPAFGQAYRSGPSFDFSNDMSIDSGNSLVDVHGTTHPEAQVMDDWCGRADDQAACVHQHGILGHLVKYQPADRMGTFHLIENGMNLALFVIALAVAWWCVKKARTTVG